MRKNGKNAKYNIHKTLKFLFLLGLILSLLAVPSYADGEERDTAEESVDGIISDFENALPGGMEELSDLGAASDVVSFKYFIENIIAIVRDGGGEFVSFLLLLVGLAMLVAVASLRDGELGSLTRGAVSLVAAALVFERMLSITRSVTESLGEINRFFSLVIPIVSAVNLTGLSAGAASAEALGMSLTLSLYSSFSGELLISLVALMMVTAALCAVEGRIFQRLAKSVRNAFVFFIGALTTFVGATFSLQSLISSYADSGALRAAKYAISGMIPIVGSSVSGALSTLMGGASYARGIVGGGAIAVVVSLAVAPLVTLLIYRLCLGVVILLTELCALDGASGVFSSFSYAFDALIAVYSLTATIYIAQLAVFMKGGVPVA